MIRLYCDVCDTEIERNYTTSRIKGSVQATAPDGIASRSIVVEVMCGIGTTWNSGHLCHACLTSAVTRALELNLRERP